MLQIIIRVENGETTNFSHRLFELQSQEFSDGEFGVS